MERGSGGLSGAAAAEILARLKYLYPKAKSGLNYTTPFELLVATILSAQCTDARVNKGNRPVVWQGQYPRRHSGFG